MFVFASEPDGMHWFKDQVVARDVFKGYDVCPHTVLTKKHASNVCHFYQMFPINTEDPIETLSVLSLCDASVFSFGSYGWFAAWIGGGPVVYSEHLNSKPANCDVVSVSGIKDFIPPSWVAV